MLQTLLIEQLRVEAYVGIYPWEKENLQSLFIDIALKIDAQQASKTDDIQYACDYEQLSRQITEQISGKRFHLIETIAKIIKDFLEKQPGILAYRIKVHKPTALKNAKNVSIQWSGRVKNPSVNVTLIE